MRKLLIIMLILVMAAIVSQTYAEEIKAIPKGWKLIAVTTGAFSPSPGKVMWFQDSSGAVYIVEVVLNQMNPNDTPRLVVTYQFPSEQKGGK